MIAFGGLAGGSLIRRSAGLVIKSCKNIKSSYLWYRTGKWQIQYMLYVVFLFVFWLLKSIRLNWPKSGPKGTPKDISFFKKKKKKQKKEKTWRSFSFLFQKSWHTFLAKIMKKLLANFFSEPFQGGFMSNLKIWTNINKLFSSDFFISHKKCNGEKVKWWKSG